MGDQLALDTGPNPYATFEGKTYLKAVIVSQVNSALAAGDQFILPPGVVFEATTGPDIRWRSIKPLPFKGRFLVEPADANTAHPLHALAHAVKRVVEVPDDCPPLGRWERADV